MSVWTDNLKKFRDDEAGAVQAAQLAEPTANASPNPDGHQIVVASWNAAGAAAMAQVGLFKKYLAEHPGPSGQTIVDGWDKPMGNWPTVPHQKRAKDRAWWYYEFARLQGYEAEKKGAPTPPPKQPPKWAPKPTGRPDSSGGVWGPGSTALGDAVMVDPVTGAELDPATGQPVVIAEGIGALIPGESAAAKLGWVGAIAAAIYFGAKALGRF